MDYFAQFYFNHLPYVIEETRQINGREENCLVIPITPNQIKRGNHGNWLVNLYIDELPPNAKMLTHEIRLMFVNAEQRNKAKRQGNFRKTQQIGRVMGRYEGTEAIDRTNNTNNECFRGSIVLSDIPKRCIFRNSENAKRYVKHLKFKNPKNPDFIYTGALCLDDIPREHTHIHKETGKRYARCIFQKLDYCDFFMNTHHLVIDTNDGSEIEIGRFKEWKKIPQDDTPYDDEHPIVTEEPTEHQISVALRPIPKSIDGVEF